MAAYLKDCISNEYDFSTLIELLVYRVRTQPEQEIYTYLKNGEIEEDKLTYEQLHLRARKIASSLQSLKVYGERALLLYQPGLDFITAFFGCLYAGVIAVPAYPPRRNQNLSRLQAIAANAKPKVILTSSKLLETIKVGFDESLELAQLQWLATDELGTDLSEEYQQPEINSNTLAFLQYTSGSTGMPKGVMVSHGNLLHNLSLIHKCFGHTPQSKGVIWLPPYHDMGLIGGILQPLYGNFPVILMSPVDFLQKPIRWLKAISDYKATTSGGPNFAYDLCVKKIKPEQIASLDLSSWQVAFTGAEPVRAHTLDQFTSAFECCGFRREAFYPCYGMAENTLIVSGGLKAQPPIIRFFDGVTLSQNRVVVVSASSKDSQAIVGCGCSWLNQEIVIVNPESLTKCRDGQVGEIWVSGASVAQGYWNKPLQTQETFNAYIAHTDVGEVEQSLGPFLRTGDLGFIVDGELFITGRIKDVIIIRGQNHYPQDIELTVQNSHQALRSNCGAAFAIEFKGEERLVIVQEVERSHLRKLNFSQVIENIRQAVVAEHGLQVYATVLVKTGSIPKTSSGKIRRHACRHSFLNGDLNVLGDWSENLEATSKFMNLKADVDSVLQKVQKNQLT